MRRGQERKGEEHGEKRFKEKRTPDLHSVKERGSREIMKGLCY